MATCTIYYSASFAAWQAPVATLLNGTAHQLVWQALDSLSEAPVSAIVLQHEQDLYRRDIPLLASRSVLLLSDEWSFDEATQWLKAGVKDSMALSDSQRIAAWIAAELARAEFSFVTQQAAQTMLQNVIDAIPVPIFYKDEHHVYRGCNQAFSEFIGLPLEKIVDHSVYDVAPKELAHVYYRADAMLLAEGGVQIYEAACQTPQGIRDIEFNKAVFYKSNGEKGGQVGVMLDVTERNLLMQKVERASRTDPLTGIGNRREFEQCVDAVLSHAKQSSQAASLLTLDIDHFKKINDAFGHSSGDEALKFLVNTVQDALPAEATLYRMGGEEFYVLLPNTDLASAKGVAEQIRAYIPTQPLILKGQIVRLTVSIGAIQLASQRQLEESFKRVDKALYEAKHSGRNRVCLAYYD
ncbi:sensor domain-containing diguanylate cyclase [Marinomonas ostreistagni]|uniref:sensor domain-containing diguanylate cyclase n=1 Tax=Marinomonas ostreistagni TaxID=359209 RepID=UPI00194F5144|nr:GGDEF domain-containing protein [Marinomonas ostreistagni]MBM6550621.1 diguanylate cyclase [Marinomonas ostreistagni]